MKPLTLSTNIFIIFLAMQRVSSCRGSGADTGRALPALRWCRSADQTGLIDPGTLQTGKFSCCTRLRHQDGSRDGADETAAVVALRRASFAPSVTRLLHLTNADASLSPDPP